MKLPLRHQPSKVVVHLKRRTNEAFRHKNDAIPGVWVGKELHARHLGGQDDTALASSKFTLSNQMWLPYPPTFTKASSKHDSPPETQALGSSTAWLTHSMVPPVSYQNHV